MNKMFVIMSFGVVFALGVGYFLFTQNLPSSVNELPDTAQTTTTNENLPVETIDSTGSTPSSENIEQSSEEQNSIDLWNPLCEETEIDDFDIEVDYTEGLTHVARNAVNGYFISLNLYNIPDPPHFLSPEEKVYAEDYIVDQLEPQRIFAGDIISVSCTLAEEAAFKSRLLTITQQQNLEKFSDTVSKFQLDELLKEVIEEASGESGITPYIFSP